MFETLKKLLEELRTKLSTHAFTGAVQGDLSALHAVLNEMAASIEKIEQAAHSGVSGQFIALMQDLKMRVENLESLLLKTAEAPAPQPGAVDEPQPPTA